MATNTYRYLSVLFCFTILYLRIAGASITVYDAYNETMETFTDTEVSHGSDLIGSLEGLLVLADPFDACNPIREAFNSSVFQTFALIFGNVSSDCPGGLKVLHAQTAGFDAVIMFSDIHSFDGFSVSNDIVIPILIVEYKVGMKIMNNYIFQKTNGSNFYWFKLTANEHFNVALRLLILCAGVLSFGVGGGLLLTLLMLIQEYVKICINRYRLSHSLRTEGTPFLRTERFTAGMQYVTCVICLEEYKQSERLTILPCDHAFHKQCIDPWLLDNHHACPLCKRQVQTGDAGSVSSSDSETSPLIASRQITVHTDGSYVTDQLTQHGKEFRRVITVINDVERDHLCQDATTTEDNSCTDRLTDAHCSGEMIVSDQLPSTYGSINNRDDEEFFDALTSGEFSISSDVLV